MLFQWLRRLFEGSPPSAPEAPAADAPRKGSLFSTDFEGGYGEVAGVASASLAQRIQDRQFGQGWAKVSKALRVVDVVPTTDGKDETKVSTGLDSSLKDAYTLASYGMPDIQAAWYGSQGFIGYQMCAILAQHWLIQKACAVPPRDAMRKGYTLSRNDGQPLDPATLKRITDLDKRYRIKRACVEYVKLARVFGIRVAMFKIASDDPEFYVKPFNIDSVGAGKYLGIAQIDPYWCVPELTTSAAMDPSSLDFYEPTYWIVNGKRVHKSHLVILRGPEVPDILKPSYLYGGLSVPQMIFERVYAAERTANEAPQLMLSKRSTYLYIDSAAALADQQKFDERMQHWRAMLDNYGVKVLDHDDKAEQHDTALSDLDVNIMTQYQLVAAIANVPATKLLGTTPKGFNATGEYEESNYHEELESIQANDIQPLLERHYACLIRSNFEGSPFGLDIAWEPLDSMTAKEQADVNLVNAQADAALVQAGAIDGNDIRERLAKDPASGYEGIPTLSDQDGLEDTDTDPQA